MVQSRKSTLLKELIAKALYGAEDDEEIGDESQEDNDGAGEEQDTSTFPKEYVEKLRKESAERRIAAKESAKELEDLKAELAKIKQAEMNDLEKATANLETLTVKQQEAEARAAAAEAALVSERVRFAVTVAAAEAGFEDPTDALSMISSEDLAGDDGEVSTKTVKARLKALADKKPYLLKRAGSGSGDGGGRGKPADQSSFEAKKKAYLEQMTATGGRVSA